MATINDTAINVDEYVDAEYTHVNNQRRLDQAVLQLNAGIITEVRRTVKSFTGVV